VVNLSSEYRSKRHDFPTPLSPMSKSFTKTSNGLPLLLLLLDDDDDGGAIV
jgi:hypothetical protein